jgi:hypothetical protein
MSDEETILVCLRCADHPVPTVESMVGWCASCGLAVWIAYSSPHAERVICDRCLVGMRQEGDIVEPPTPEQLRDILRKRR